MKTKASAIFLSHGGGPLPLLGDAAHKEMVECLREIAGTIEKPSAIITVSAHWEQPLPSITAGENPSLIYDYHGFPKESYSIEYPCPGEPSLATMIYQALGNAGIEARLDHDRGLDHGVFVPLKLIYPDADIPCVQLSLLDSLDPLQHIRIGQALQGLGYDDLLLIGSGSSFHNMHQFFKPETEETRARNESFEAWLIDTCSNTAIQEAERTNRLCHWLKAPSARFCHPREEHLLPLHVCYGIAQSASSRYFELAILNKKASMYIW
ncbi:MAG: class III extradiol ring-cleavage dioxygenase [Candidatus Thiodiazotropha sp.]